MIHYLKCWPLHFWDVCAGLKRYEVRKNDRNFHLGDTLVLQEWRPELEEYTGETLTVVVTHILQGGQFGIESGYCILSIETEAE